MDSWRARTDSTHRRRCYSADTVMSSWVDEKLERCYQLMETEDRRRLDEWMANWNDLIDFEVHPVITSKQAMDKLGPLL